MITVLFQTESHFPVNRKKVIEAVTEALTPQMKRHTEISVSIVGDRRMRQLNKQYRNIDVTTDVLSFPLNDPSEKPDAPFIDTPDGILRLGDIIVSFPQAVEEAREENRLVDDQIVVLVLHGLNHLLGIHHPE
jgi:probable rRNA maturation factor